MTARTREDYDRELEGLTQAHIQNEAGRDAFVALAHTALFAASVSFVADVTPLAVAVWKPALIAGWACNVAGLLALTVSFGASRRLIDARRAAINHGEPPSGALDMLNAISLWSFPLSILCLFSFVTANVVSDHDGKTPSASNPSVPPFATSHSAALAENAGQREPAHGQHAISVVPGHRTSRDNAAAPCTSVSTARDAGAKPDAVPALRSAGQPLTTPASGVPTPCS